MFKHKTEGDILIILELLILGFCQGCTHQVNYMQFVWHLLQHVQLDLYLMTHYYIGSNNE